jgi:hypothetical protein
MTSTKELIICSVGSGRGDRFVSRRVMNTVGSSVMMLSGVSGGNENSARLKKLAIYFA